MPAPAAAKTASPSPAVVQEAAKWLSRLWSDAAGPDDVHACAVWRAQKPEHELAWQRLQQLSAKFDGVPKAIGRHTLRTAHNQSRRAVLRMLGWGIVAGGAVGGARESGFWQRHAADYSTAAGEWKHVVLADGSKLMLNTATAVDIAFDATTRRVLLTAGEIYITTAPDPQRPFLVETRDGAVRALGTRYSVRKLDGATQVSVYQHAVEIAPRHSAERLQLSAGEKTVLTSDIAGTANALNAEAPDWASRRLVAERMRLDDFLAEVGRYRNGILRCDPRVAGLRVTGVFPLNDTDRALAALAEGLPVELEWRTRFWLNVRPRDAS